jgi:L-iditol 2-dehydrogenase
MKALVKTAPGPGQVELRDMPEPVPAPDQVKFEIAACGVCGTDLHVMRDTFRNFPPVILGHEFAGRVVAEGAAVRGRTDPHAHYAVLGATAVVDPADPFVRAGHFILSPTRRGMGHGVHGAFCRYAVVRPDQLFQLGATVPVEEGALVEPLAAAVHAVAEQTEIRAGDVALVSGPGPIGLYCLMVLRHLGIKTLVAGTTADAPRLALARELGAARTIDVETESLLDAVCAEAGPLGVDLAFEVAGAAPSAAACLDALRPLGQYTQVGHFGRDIAVPFDRIGFKQLRVTGSVGYTVATWTRTLNLIAQGLRPSRIVTHRLPLARWAEAFDLFDRKVAAKVLLLP